MPIGSPSARALVREVESKIDFTVIPGISAIESKLDQWDLAAIDEMLSAIESKLDNTIIVDIDDIQDMLSAIESKIDLTVIPGISAIESKLDLLDLAAVDEMLSAIESKIDLTLIRDLSLIESKLDQLDLAAVDEMLSAIESKIDGATGIMQAISAVESKLDQWDLADVDEMLSAIESKIDGATGIMQAISAIESKLDAGIAVEIFRSNYFLEGSSTIVDLGKTTATTVWADVNTSDISIKAFTISIIPGGYTGAMYYRVMADLAPAVKRFPFASSEILLTDDYEAILDEMINVKSGESVIIQVVHVGSTGASDIGTASALITSLKYMEWT